MALRELNLDGMTDFAGGSVEAIFNRHVQRAIADCEDRPGEKKPRKVTLTANIMPVILQEGGITDVAVDCEVTCAIPKHISKTVDCRVKVGGRAIFNDMSEDDVDQMTIDEA